MTAMDANFEKLNKEQWRDLIASSLKLNSVDDIVWRIDHYINGEAFAHPDDIKFPLGSFSSAKVDNSWLFGLDYSLIKYERINDYMKSHLKFGLQSIIVDVNDSQLNFESIFQGVDLNLLELNINTRYGVDPIWMMENLKDYLISTGYNIDKLKINLRLPLDIPDEMIELFKYLQLNFSGISYYLRSNKSQSYNPTEYLSETFNMLTEFIESSEIDENTVVKLLKKLKFHFFLTENFLTDIVVLSAFKILWYNYLDVLNLKRTDDSIMVGINHNAFSENNNNNFIIATISILAGAISGVHSINPAPLDTEDFDSGDVMRLFLNIQNLLKFESNIHLVKDAINGSYALDVAATRMAEEIWRNLK